MTLRRRNGGRTGNGEGDKQGNAESEQSDRKFRAGASVRHKKAHNLLKPTTQKDSLSPAVSTTVNIFTDLKTYLSPAVSTTVKGVHTAGLLHLYSDYINSHIVTESKKRTIG